VLNLLSPNRRPYRTPSQSPEYQHRDSHVTYGIPPLRYGSESGSDSSLSPPATPIEAHATLQSFLSRSIEGRKSWKTLRGGEIVWPPELEAALIEGTYNTIRPFFCPKVFDSSLPGLENYQLNNSRDTRFLGRFPMKNKFISDWIFRKTGERRTAKQVDSRLQKIRDTCGGKRCEYILVK